MSLSCKIVVPQQQQYHKRFKILHNPCFQQHPFVSFPKKCFHSSGVQLMGFSSTMPSILSSGNSGLLINRCTSEKFSDSLGPNDSESLEHHQRFKILHNPCFQQHPFVSFPKKCFHSSGVQLMGFPSTMQSILPSGNSGLLINRCISERFSDSLGPDDSESLENLKQKENALLTILKGANSYLPHVVLASTILALIYPPSFTWFTNRYYAPALGFLMFAVGVNSSEKDFLEAFKKPGAIFAGYIGQFAVKPLLGYLFGTAAMTVFGLPTSLAAGIMLTSCVSGAQLSNYATFLTDPQMAPLSIVMTSFSTASAVFLTPILSLLLIGKKLPVDVKGMIANILQIVVTPIAAGLLLNRFFPQISNAIRPLLPPLSVLVTALCVGAPLAINIESVVSPSGMSVLFLVIAFHLSAFILGYLLSGLAFHKAPDVKPLQRTLSYETGMQSSLLALALANKFFQDPLIGVPPAISVVIMSLMGFSLVMLWAKKKETVMG